MSTTQTTPGQQQAPKTTQAGIVPGANLPSVTPGPVDLASVQQTVAALNTVQASVTALVNGLVTEVNRLASMPALMLSDQMKKFNEDFQKLAGQPGGASAADLQKLVTELANAAQPGPVYSITIQEFAQQLSTSAAGLAAAVVANTPVAVPAKEK